MKTMKSIAFLVLLLLALSMVCAAKPTTKPDQDIIAVVTNDFGTLDYQLFGEPKMKDSRGIIQDQLEMLANTFDWDTPITTQMKRLGMKDWALVARDEGIVESQKELEERWSPIWQSRLLKDGDKVKTGANSLATIIFPDESKIIIGPNTMVNLEKDMFKKKITLQFYLGTIYARFSSDVQRFFGKENDFEITTPNGALSSRGTEYEVNVDQEKTTIRVYEGIVDVRSFYDNQTSVIPAGKQGIVWSNKSTEVTLFEDQELLEIFMGEPPCSGSWVSFATENSTVPEYNVNFNITLPPSTGNDWKRNVNRIMSEINAVDLETALADTPDISGKRYCMRTDLKQTLALGTNKLLDPSTVNSRTVRVLNNNKPVDGLYEVDSAIIFIPSKPLYGQIQIVVEGGKEGVCSRTKVCLEQDYAFELEGAPEPSSEEKELTYELRNTVPALLTKDIVVTNTGETTVRDATVSIYSYKTYFPNTFIQMQNISSPVPYEIIPVGENEIHKFMIKELPPGEKIIINESYAALTFGVEYFQRLDVSGLLGYDNSTLVAMFTQPEKGVESDNPEIISLAQKIVGDEKNPFWKAYKIYNWVTQNIRYDHEKEAWITQSVQDRRAGLASYSASYPSDGALSTLYNGKGVCYDYARLYIALARAAGIPSRIVLLDVLSEGGEMQGHSIVEVYLPKYGWIPLDPTWGTAYDNFAREEPYLFFEYKQDGLSPEYEYLSEGENAGQLDVLIFKDVNSPGEGDEQEWFDRLSDPFFKDMYELVLTTGLRENLEEIGTYNRILNKSLFIVPSQSKTSPVAITSKSIQAYQNQEYSLVQQTVRTAIAKNLDSSFDSFISLSEKSRDYIQKEGELVSEQEQQFQEMLANNPGKISFSFKTRYQDVNGTFVPMNYSKVLDELDTIRNLASELKAALNPDNPSTVAGAFTKLFYNSKLTLDEWAYRIVSDLVSGTTLVPESTETSAFTKQEAAPLTFLEEIIKWFFLIFLFALLILTPAFWLWMLIHCLIRKEFRHLNKIGWFLIILFTSFFFLIGAILYFILEYRKRNKTGGRVKK